MQTLWQNGARPTAALRQVCLLCRVQVGCKWVTGCCLLCGLRDWQQTVSGSRLSLIKMSSESLKCCLSRPRSQNAVDA